MSFRNRLPLAAVLGLAVPLFALPGSIAADEGKNESGKRGGYKVERREGDCKYEFKAGPGGSKEEWKCGNGGRRYPATAVPFPPGRAIPKGHLPPPGECRIWYRGREPGQQPPPRPCRELYGRVPPGAFIVRGR